MIVIHGFKDQHLTLQEALDMLAHCLIGAEGECDLTIGNITKTCREWQKTPYCSILISEAMNDSARQLKYWMEQLGQEENKQLCGVVENLKAVHRYMKG